jgi:hypothetical protein
MKKLKERIEEQYMKVLLCEDDILELECKLKQAKLELERQTNLLRLMEEVGDMLIARPELSQAMRKLVG